MSERIRVTHLFDCADVGKALVAAGRSQGEPWRIVQGPWTRGGTKAAYYRFRLEQAAAYARSEMWHVHMGGRARWARGAFARPYALTLHGTDIRENYWQEQHHAVMKEDIDKAGHVWYATPDLREKAEKARADAEYCPIPLNLAELPQWEPNTKPRIIFPSRWDSSKGGDTLIGMATELTQALAGRDVDLIGLDWGDRAPEAAALGIQLLPRMPKAQFLKEIAKSHLAVGQAAGILATSELEAVGIGVPTIFPNRVDGYPDDLATVSVDLDNVAQAAVESLVDPIALSKKLDGPGYIKRYHSADVLVPMLNAGYKKTLESKA